jgi:competence protein ComEC
MNMVPVRKLRIKGQLFYLAGFALLGLLAVLENPYIYGGLFFAAILFLYWYKKLSAAMLMVFAICFLIFLVAGFHEKDHLITHLHGNEKDFLILFDNEINLDGDTLFAYARLYSENEKVAIRYRAKSEVEKNTLKKQLLPGTACKVSGSLELPSAARNPNAFDYQNYLKRMQISWVITIEDLDVQQCSSDHTGGWLAAIKSFRQKEINKIETHFPGETAALSAALLFGERDLFNPETERSYQKIGVVHLLAISGLHVGLIGRMLYSFCIRIGITKEKTELIMLVTLPLYAVITGLAPPVIRAAAMLMLIIAARRYHWQLTPLDAISITFMFIAFIQPFLIFDIGFQLSFSVSFTLVISAPKILISFSSLLKQTAAASFISQLASLPIILSSFYEISVISIFANILFVPLFSFIILPLLLASYGAFSLIGSLPSSYIKLLENVIHYVNQLSALLAEVPGATVVTGKPGETILILQIALIPLFFFVWENSISKKSKPKRWYFLLPIIPILIQLLLPYINPYGKIIFIDVGQGDSIFIRMPFNKGNYLIDAGGIMAFEKQDWQLKNAVFDPGRNIVLPLLKSEGVGEIDKLILTHGDADHIGGSSALFGEIQIKQLILPKATDRSMMEMDIIKKAIGGGTVIRSVGAGSGWKVPGGDFYILNPSGNTGDRNERSIVLFANIGGKKWLFTGDLGIEGEQIFLRNFGDLSIDVLKVGHHGSKYSSSEAFLDSLEPKYAVITVGAKNRYGHPAGEVLDRLMNEHIHIYRTDLNGAVIYRFKGDSGTFFTQFP